MAYSTLETSTDSGKPVELFNFSYSGAMWYYTNSPTPIVHLANTYTPIGIMRGAINSPGDVSKSSLEIVSVADLPVALLFAQYPPSEPIILTVYGHHALDNEFAVLWKGRVLNVEWNDSQQVTLRSESVFTSLQRPGLGRTFQAQCPYALYSHQCGVSNIAFRKKPTVTSIAGRVVTVNDIMPAGYYAGGYAIWYNPSTRANEKRAIKESSADGKINLSTFPIGLSVGDMIEIYAGCDHTLNGENGCTVKFANFIRFGGTPWQPEKNPFGGSSIY